MKKVKENILQNIHTLNVCKVAMCVNLCNNTNTDNNDDAKALVLS